MGNKFKINGTVSAKDLIAENTLVVQGNLDVKGTTTTVNTKNLTVDDNLIVTNAQGSATPYTGVVSLTGNTTTKVVPDIIYQGNTYVSFSDFYPIIGNTDGRDFRIPLNFNVVKDIEGTTTYTQYKLIGIMNVQSGMSIGYYDMNNVRVTMDNIPPMQVIGTNLLNDLQIKCLKVLYPNIQLENLEEAYATAIYNTADNEIQLGKGYITRTEDDEVEFTFGNNENQALATRSSELVNNDIVYWDADKKTLSASGIVAKGNGTIIGGRSTQPEDNALSLVTKDYTDKLKLEFNETCEYETEYFDIENPTEIIDVSNSEYLLQVNYKALFSKIGSTVRGLTPIITMENHVIFDIEDNYYIENRRITVPMVAETYNGDREFELFINILGSQIDFDISNRAFLYKAEPEELVDNTSGVRVLGFIPNPSLGLKECRIDTSKTIKIGLVNEDEPTSMKYKYFIDYLLWKAREGNIN